jgi:hypothetical protein
MSATNGSAAAPRIVYQLEAGTLTWISVSAPDAVLIIDTPGPTLFAGTANC